MHECMHDTKTPSGCDADEDGEAPFKSLTREEALALRARHPPLSPWRIVAVQAVAGLLAAALAWWFGGSVGVAVSSLYGAAAVVLPTALLAHGMTRRYGTGSNAAAFSFVLWEFVKIGLTVAMLAAATWVVPDLSWPALLVTMIVCMKVNWLALLWRGRVTTTRS